MNRALHFDPDAHRSRLDLAIPRQWEPTSTSNQSQSQTPNTQSYHIEADIVTLSVSAPHPATARVSFGILPSIERMGKHIGMREEGTDPYHRRLLRVIGGKLHIFRFEIGAPPSPCEEQWVYRGDHVDVGVL